MLQVANLEKRFGNLKALDGVSFDVRRGSCFGLLGPNGAGKSTTISLIVGIVKPDSGSVLINGTPIKGPTDAIRSKIGYVPQEIALYEELDCRENLRLFGVLYGLKSGDLEARIVECLEIVGLADRAKEPVKNFSGGMKRRLNIAVALVHRPELLILDEPTVGVDPQSRNAIFDCLIDLRKQGMTLIYTTHYMEEVQKLCDTIAIMDHGKVVACGTQEELFQLLPAKNKLVLKFLDEQSAGMAVGVLSRLEFSSEPYLQSNQVELQPMQLSKGITDVVNTLHNAGIEFTNLSSQQATLEELFLHCTGRSLRD